MLPNATNLLGFKALSFFKDTLLSVIEAKIGDKTCGHYFAFWRWGAEKLAWGHL